jgi:hypothetical protein
MNRYAIIDTLTNDVINIIVYDGVSELNLGNNYQIALASDEHYTKYNEYISLKYPNNPNDDNRQQP